MVLCILTLEDGRLREERRKYRCKFCNLELYSKEECDLHQDKCDLNPNLLTDTKPISFVSFVASSTLKIVLLALAVLSPGFMYLFLLISHFPPPYDYVALGIFWIFIFGIPSVLAIVVDYMRKRGTGGHQV
jgi:hypothetical protein